jgi:quinol---cytochrome-c reductase cytochrome c subunit
MRRLLIPLLLALTVLATTGAGWTAVQASKSDSRNARVTQGEHLYGQYCLACHGENGAGVYRARTIGAGPLRQQSSQQALGPALQGVGALAADFYLRTGYMPLQRVGAQPHRTRVRFEETQIRALVAYVASLGKGPAIPTPHPESGSLSQGQHLFTEHCAGCHQIVGGGGYVTGAVPPSLASATPRQIAEAVRVGPYVMPRFTEKAVSDRKLDSIIRYVEYAKHPDNRGGWALGNLGPVPEGLVTWFIGLVALVAVCLVIGRRLHA